MQPKRPISSKPTEKPSVLKKRMIKPTIKEVEDYILVKKPDWPLLFIEYYAAKFWNHYEASGWKLSGGNLVKNWQACFNSNWQEVKYDSVQLLQKYTAQQVTAKKIVIEKRNGEFTPEYMNEVLVDYKKNYSTISSETLSAYYFWMKARGFIKITPDEVVKIKELYSDKRIEGMAACVRISFDKMINYCITFTYGTRQR